LKPFKVLVVDDHEFVRAGIRFVIEQSGDYRVCGEAADGRVAIEETRRLRPDLVILDTGLPLLNGLEAARQILSRFPQQQILVYSDIHAEQLMKDVIEAGIRGFVLKSDPASDLLAAATALLQGRTFYTACMTNMILGIVKQQCESFLTMREREIIQLVAEGICSKEIAAKLDISIKTVETHRTHLRQKLKIHSVAQLILYAIRNRIIHVSPSILATGSSHLAERELYASIALPNGEMARAYAAE
jgi:DNA-binding NarL/FixJ family response regulator